MTVTETQVPSRDDWFLLGADFRKAQVVRPGAPSSFLLLLVRHLLLEAMHLFLVAYCYLPIFAICRIS